MAGRTTARLGVVVAMLGALLSIAQAVPAASADTTPPQGTPATVSADALPTVQVNGIVWATAIRGNIVYATGRFSQARPAGVPVGGRGSVRRGNLLAFDITTGRLLTSFVHYLGGGPTPEGRSIAVSPDGTRLYVGGHFQRVDGRPHTNFAVIDLRRNRVLPGDQGPNATVLAIAATNRMAYVGGDFSRAGGRVRHLLAAYSTAGSVMTRWVANVSGARGSHVAALVAVPRVGRLIVGGSFNAVQGRRYFSLAALNLTTGAPVTPWASQRLAFPIRMQPPPGTSGFSLGITSLQTDNTKVYLSAFTSVGGRRPGTFEGTAAISPVDGHLIFANDCHGDTYDVFPVGKVMYSVGHPHDCSAIGGYPQLPLHWQRALAETTSPSGTDTASSTPQGYPTFAGRPKSELLNWFPSLAIANVSGSHEAAWTVVATSRYVVLGGEFPSVNGRPQQGLVRFAVKAAAPNKVGPSRYPDAGYGVTATPADAGGHSTVHVYTVGDPDNRRLTYSVTRPGGGSPVIRTIPSSFWRADGFTFTDTGLTPGTSADYVVTVTDPFGNSRVLDGVTAWDDTDPRITYSGGWTTATGLPDTTPDFARTLHYATAAGASYQFGFDGTAFTLVGETSPAQGQIQVVIDGGAPITVDTSGTIRQFAQRIYQSPALAAGPHTVVVTKATGASISVDAVRVTTSG